MSSVERPLAPQTGSGSHWAPLLLVLAFTLFIHAAILSDGFRISLLEPDGPSQYFDATADALIEGRLDVDPYHVGNEAFLFGDTTYGYFGITPALLRVPLHALVPSLWGHWERLMMLLAAAVTLLGAHALALAALATTPARSPLLRQAAHGLYLLIIGLGSTTLFLTSRPNVFHEASAWGTGLTLAGFAALARWLRKPTPLSAALVATLCVAALHARLVVGLGLMLSVALVATLGLLRAWSGKRAPNRAASWVVQLAIRAPAPQLFVLALGALIACGSYAGLSFAKFGTVASLPMERNLQSSAERLAKTGGQQLGLVYAASNAYNHFMPWNLRLSTDGEPVRAVPPNALLTPKGADYDWREPVVGLAGASPALCCLGVLGIFALLRNRDQRRFRALAIGSAASVAPPLLYFAITQRYAHDMLPTLAVTAAFALPAVERLTAARRRIGFAMLLLASAWSAFVWFHVTVSYREWARDLRISPVRADVIVPAYERELRRHPNKATLHVELALIDLQAGRRDRGRAHLTRALEIDSTHEAAILQLAKLEQLENKQAGIDVLRDAVKKSPRAANLRSALAMLLLAEGREQEAVEQLGHALEAAPEDERVRNLLAQVEAVRAKRATTLQPKAAAPPATP